MNCNKLTLITIFSLLFLSVFSLSAQDIVISGTVVDTEGQPVIGAGVFCKGQESIGVTTDVDGSFSLKVPKGTVALKISSLGINMKVWEGETTQSMAKGLGHYISTSAWNGNIGICGHYPDRIRARTSIRPESVDNK